MAWISFLLVIVWTVVIGGEVYAQDVADSDSVKVLKRAIQGAVTGAAATMAASDEDLDEDITKLIEEGEESLETGEITKRPPGWDKGKKEGWGDADIPPGLSKEGKAYPKGLTKPAKAKGKKNK